jgi:epoxyqueuosine reductase QueG
MEDRIKKLFLDLGADLCGIANIDRFSEAPAGYRPTDIYQSCRSVIVFAKSLPAGLREVSPRIVYNHANDINLSEIDRIGLEACGYIEEWGGTAVPVPCDGPYEYWDSEKLEGRGILSMRHAAVLAGLGRMGKSSLVITREFGNMINIGAVLTNLDLKSDPLAEELCIEGCSLCLDNCPQKAIRDRTVIQKLCREHTYGTNDRGFSVCKCNTCRVICPLSSGRGRRHAAAKEDTI